MDKKVNLEDKDIIVASYTHIADGRYTTLGGPALSLKDYLKNRTKRLVCIWQPVPLSDTLSAIAEIYERNKPLKNYRFYVINWPFGRKKVISFIYIALKVRDIFSVLYFVLRLRWRFDIFIGVEALNALVGIFLRNLGIIKTVIYYNLDYGKIRFTNPVLNYLFHTLDKWAVFHSNYTWCLSEQMILSRQERGTCHKKTPPQLMVPIGIDFSKINPLPLQEIDRKKIVYLGLLARIQDVQLLIESMPEIVKTVPEAKLVIIGTGLLESTLKQMVSNYGLDGKVEFTGLVSDEKVLEILCRCAIGVAPYLDEPNSTKRFTDPTKPKMYLACGLPVVITKVSPFADEIQNNGAGIAINYSKQELIQAITSLLKNDSLYRLYRKNAIEFISKYNWEDIFDRAFTVLFKS